MPFSDQSNHEATKDVLESYRPDFILPLFVALGVDKFHPAEYECLERSPALGKKPVVPFLQELGKSELASGVKLHYLKQGLTSAFCKLFIFSFPLGNISLWWCRKHQLLIRKHTFVVASCWRLTVALC